MMSGGSPASSRVRSSSCSRYNGSRRRRKACGRGALRTGERRERNRQKWNIGLLLLSFPGIDASAQSPRAAGRADVGKEEIRLRPQRKAFASGRGSGFEQPPKVFAAAQRVEILVGPQVLSLRAPFGLVGGRPRSGQQRHHLFGIAAG